MSLKNEGSFSQERKKLGESQNLTEEVKKSTIDETVVDSYLEKAKKGDAWAMHSVALYFLEKEQDDQCYFWLKKGADAGNLDCLKSLADLYVSGRGVDKNLDLARYYYNLAAEKGNPAAKFEYGKILYEFPDNEEDKHQGLVYLSEASANHNYKDATEYLAKNNIESLIKPYEYRVEDELKNLNYPKDFQQLLLRAHKGDQDAMRETISYYINHSDVLEVTIHGIFYWGKKLSEAGSSHGDVYLAILYRDDRLFEPDYEKSSYHYELAVKKNNYYACANYGIILYEGDHIIQNQKRGLALIRKAAGKEQKEAIEYLKSHNLLMHDPNIINDYTKLKMKLGYSEIKVVNPALVSEEKMEEYIKKFKTKMINDVNVCPIFKKALQENSKNIKVSANIIYDVLNYQGYELRYNAVIEIPYYDKVYAGKNSQGSPYYKDVLKYQSKLYQVDLENKAYYLMKSKVYNAQQCLSMLNTFDVEECEYNVEYNSKEAYDADEAFKDLENNIEEICRNYARHDYGSNIRFKESRYENVNLDEAKCYLFPEVEFIVDFEGEFYRSTLRFEQKDQIMKPYYYTYNYKKNLQIIEKANEYEILKLKIKTRRIINLLQIPLLIIAVGCIYKANIFTGVFAFVVAMIRLMVKKIKLKKKIKILKSQTTISEHLVQYCNNDSLSEMYDKLYPKRVSILSIIINIVLILAVIVVYVLRTIIYV